MIMTELAMMDPGPAGGSVVARGFRAVAQFFGFGQLPAVDLMHSCPVVPSVDRGNFLEPAVRPLPARDNTVAPTGGAFRWRRHAQLLDRPTSPLPEEERLARLHAVRGLYAARRGALEVAEHHFSLAAACSGIDLCELPGFWQLSRSAMMAAARAYDKAGRLREASALSARIRTQYRPRVLAAVAPNMTELPTRRLSLTSSS